MNEHHELEILMVEDNRHDAELARRALHDRRLANKLSWVKDGAAALDFLFGPEPSATGGLACRPRIVLLDLKLPKVNGLEVLRRIKSHPEARSIPVVVLTSSREEPDIARSYELGANSYIVKPVNFDNFSEVVAQLGMYWVLCNQPLDTASGLPGQEARR